MFSRASVKPHDFVKLHFGRRSVHISGQLFIAMVRADENKRAAEHRLQKWYDEEESNMNRGCHHCNCEDSPLSDGRTLLCLELSLSRRAIVIGCPFHSFHFHVYCWNLKHLFHFCKFSDPAPHDQFDVRMSARALDWHTRTCSSSAESLLFRCPKWK